MNGRFCAVVVWIARWLAPGVCALAILIALPTVGAQAGAADPNPRALCAKLGGDFVAVNGAQNCVRIGGHVRAVPMNGSPAFAVRAAPEADGVRPASEVFGATAAAPSADQRLYRR